MRKTLIVVALGCVLAGFIFGLAAGYFLGYWTIYGFPTYPQEFKAVLPP